MAASLKEAVSRRFLDDILGPFIKSNKWVVLILDKRATRALSSSFTVSDVLSKNVMVLENIERERKDLPNDEALYLVSPEEASIDRITGDFQGRAKYRAVHIYFLEACPDELFRKISSCKLLSSRIKTLKEVDLAFIPIESKVFSLDQSDALSDFYSPSGDKYLERMADDLVTVCSLLAEYPHVRYRNGVRRLNEFAELVQQKLDQCKADNPSLGSGRGKDKSELIILDRGFDVVSPLVHEITYQALAYDMLDIKNDVYSYKAESIGGAEKKKEVILNENDAIWVEQRHLPINEAIDKVTTDYNDFVKKRKMMKQAITKATSDNSEVKDMSRLLKEYPQYQRALAAHSTHYHLARDCNKQLDRIAPLCAVEQDLVMGATARGEPLRNANNLVYDILFSKKGESSGEVYSESDKFRVLALYILYNEGIPNEDFRKMVEYAKLDKEYRQALINLQHLGVTILKDQKKKGGPGLKRIDRNWQDKYQIARWTPLVQDVIEYAMDGKLDESYCPYLKDRSRPLQRSSGSSGASKTAESVKWDWRGGGAVSKQDAKQQGEGSLIIYILGGVTYSEMRTVYEVAKTKTSHELFIGGSSILTAQKFISDIKKLPPA